MLHQDITKRIIDAAMKVHTALGPGLLESTCSACLYYEFTVGGLQFRHQVGLPVVYQGIQLDAGYGIDFLVENCVIVELKAAEKLLQVHVAQVMTYLNLSGRPVGLIINFNVPHLRDGIRRIVNGYGEPKQDSSSVSPVSSVVESSTPEDTGNTDPSGN